MFTLVKRLFLTLAFLALIATNVLTLTHTAFNAALSGLLSTKLGMQTVSGKLDRQLKAKSKIIKKQSATLAKRKIATKKFGKRLASRTKRVAAASMAGVSGKSIPLIGTTLLIAGTGYELYLACENMRDLDELYSDIGMTDESPGGMLHSVCDPSWSAAGNFWGGTIKKGRGWLGKAYEIIKLPLSLPDKFIHFP